MSVSHLRFDVVKFEHNYITHTLWSLCCTSINFAGNQAYLVSTTTSKFLLKLTFVMLLLLVVLVRYENVDTSTWIYFVRLQQQYGIDFQNYLMASEIHAEINNASQ